MDDFIGPTRIVRPNFYHRPVSAPGEQEYFDQRVKETVAEVGREELICRISEWVSAVAEALRSDDKSVAFREVIYDIEPSDGDCRKLSREVDQSSILLSLKHPKLRKMTAKRRHCEWMRRAEAQWGARWVEASKPLYVQTGFEYSPYEGSRYPERWEPVGIDVHVTSEGSLRWIDMYRSEGTLDLQGSEDALLVSLYNEVLKNPA